VSKKKTNEGVRARVTVFPRPEILDPQGKAIAGALGRLGFDVAEVRAGKSFDLVLTGVDAKGAHAAAEQMADKLLANTVVEDFTVEILDVDG
jgi:phosphoribosylformylglycinamidine synthase